MSTDQDSWRASLEFPPAPAAPAAPAELGRVTFRDGAGGDMPNLWAAHMLRLWHQAEKDGAKPPKFSDALKTTAAHFMMGGVA